MLEKPFTFSNCCEVKAVAAPKRVGYFNLKLTYTQCRNSANNSAKWLHFSYLLIQGFHSGEKNNKLEYKWKLKNGIYTYRPGDVMENTSSKGHAHD